MFEKKFPRESVDDPYLPPVEEVLNLRQRGMSRDQIASNLEKNYSSTQIDDAMTQAEIKRGISGNYPYSEPNLKQLEQSAPAPSSSRSHDMEPSFRGDEDYSYEEPGPQFSQQPIIPVNQPNYDEEHVEELVESVVSEKWDELSSKFGDLGVWKETTKNDIESIKQEILRFEQRLENLQKAVLSKVSDYDKDIKSIGTDIRALEQVLQRVLGPLTTNVKELSKLAEEIKSRKSTPRRNKKK